MYKKYGDSKITDKAFEIELKSLVEELLIPEIQTLKRIKGLNKDSEQKQQFKYKTKNNNCTFNQKTLNLQEGIVQRCYNLKLEIET